MLRNNIIGTGSFTFTNVTSTMVPTGLTVSWSAGWADYNGDGWVDVFVGQDNSRQQYRRRAAKQWRDVVRRTRPMRRA